MPWEAILNAVDPDVVTAFILAVLAVVGFYLTFYRTAISDRNNERERAEYAEAKTVELLKEQIAEYREEKRTAEIVAEIRRQEQTEGSRKDVG